MAIKNPYAQYKQNSILTASPEELTLMLYEGMIKFINMAKLYIEEKNMEKAHHANVRAQDIVMELNVTLNMDYEISQNLRSLYSYMYRRLVDANVKKDTAILDEVLEIAAELRDAWKEAMKIAKKSR
ncbi:MAG: flagellar export chaperone FliS [Bacillota bacterium]